MENLNVTIGEELTLLELDQLINGQIEKYDITRDLVILEDKVGSLDVDGINYVFSFDEFNTEDELQTVIVVTDIFEI